MNPPTVPPSPSAVVAAFDVDGTLTVRDCVVPFLRSAAGTRRLITAVLSRPVPLLRAVLGRDRDSLKALAVRSLRGRSVAEIDELGARFAERVHADWLRGDTSARLAWHVAEGHEVVLVSASLRAYLAPLARPLGAAHVLCCEVAAADGRLTGELDGPNCRGPEKVRRLRTWLGERNVELWAYGDSTGDRELLAFADHAHLVKDVTIGARP
jgi:phosphatidylglycerophosphatase C